MGRIGVFVVVALVVGAVTFLVTDNDDLTDAPVDGRNTASPSPEPADTTPPVEENPEPPAGFDAYANRAGYAFHYPASWNLDERRTAVEIVASDSSIAMSFGLAPRGDIRAGVGTFLQTIEETYDVQEVRGPTDTTVGTSPAVVVEGVALNDDGVELEFMAFVVAGGPDNFAIAVFSSTDADRSEIPMILSSFAASS